MELRHLVSFLAVVDSGSASRAAGNLHLTQSALSRHVAELERDLGQPLFTRGARGMLVTPAGLAVAARARHLVTEAASLHEVARVADAAEHHVRLGIPPGLPSGWLRDRVPAAPYRLTLREAPSDEQQRLLLGREIDIALSHGELPGARCRPVLRQPLGVAVRPGSDLDRRTSSATGERALDVRDLDGVVVMAHSMGRIRSLEERLSSAVEQAGAEAVWVFRHFSQHGEVVADFAGADAVVTTLSSAGQNFPTWHWATLIGRHRRDSLTLRTWACHLPDAPASTRQLVEHLADPAPPDEPASPERSPQSQEWL